MQSVIARPDDRAAVLRQAKAAGVFQFFVYTLSVASLAAAADATDTVTMDTGADFDLVRIGYFADIAAAVQTDSSRVLPLVKLQLDDSDSSRKVFSEQTPIPALFGAGATVYDLPLRQRLRRASTLTGTFTNYSASTTYNLYVALIGYKIFPR